MGAGASGRRSGRNTARGGVAGGGGGVTPSRQGEGGRVPEPSSWLSLRSPAPTETPSAAAAADSSGANRRDRYGGDIGRDLSNEGRRRRRERPPGALRRGRSNHHNRRPQNRILCHTCERTYPTTEPEPIRSCPECGGAFVELIAVPMQDPIERVLQNAAISGAFRDSDNIGEGVGRRNRRRGRNRNRSDDHYGGNRGGSSRLVRSPRSLLPFLGDNNNLNTEEVLFNLVFFADEAVAREEKERKAQHRALVSYVASLSAPWGRSVVAEAKIKNESSTLHGMGGSKDGAECVGENVMDFEAKKCGESLVSIPVARIAVEAKESTADVESRDIHDQGVVAERAADAKYSSTRVYEGPEEELASSGVITVYDESKEFELRSCSDVDNGEIRESGNRAKAGMIKCVHVDGEVKGDGNENGINGQEGIVKGKEKNVISNPRGDPRADPRGDEDECAVCAELFVAGDSVVELPFCSHVFHCACILRWLQEQANCPCCRADICLPGVVKGEIIASTIKPVEAVEVSEISSNGDGQQDVRNDGVVEAQEQHLDSEEELQYGRRHTNGTVEEINEGQDHVAWSDSSVFSVGDEEVFDASLEDLAVTTVAGAIDVAVGSVIVVPQTLRSVGVMTGS